MIPWPPSADPVQQWRYSLVATAARMRRAGMVSLLFLLTGCSALHQPYTRTIEHKMEVLSRIPRSEFRSIDLRLLGQTPPPEHLVSDGDILGVYLEGFGGESSAMPVRFPDDRFVAPAIGYPTPVRNGGYIRLPYAGVPGGGVLNVNGSTVWQIEERIRELLTTGPNAPVQPDRIQIHVSMMWKRAVNVMVVRQEEVAPTKLVAPSSGKEPDRRSGQVVELPAFRNDVLNALLETGGLPNDQAENAVYIFKRHDRQLAGFAGTHVASSSMPQIASRSQPLFNNSGPAAFVSGVQQAGYLTPQPERLSPLLRGGHTEPFVAQRTAPLSALGETCSSESPHPSAIRIPLSMSDGEPIPFSQNDVILEDGDIVLVESRDDEHFFTAGLLGGGEYTLPRNQDIDVIDAVLLAGTYSRSTQLNTPTRAIGGVSVLNRDVTVGASRVIIERKMANGCINRFRVNLYNAMKNPDQRVIIEPGDRLYLEYTPIEAWLAAFERHLLDPFLSGSPALLN